MKLYRVYVCEMIEVEADALPDEETEVVVNLRDCKTLTTAIDIHQHQFLRVCLERDRWQRKVFELQREVDRINFIASEGWGTSGETRALEQIHKLTTPLLVQRVKEMGSK